MDKDYSVEKTFSTKLACPEHGVSIEELEPRISFGFASAASADISVFQVARTCAIEQFFLELLR